MKSAPQIWKAAELDGVACVVDATACWRNSCRRLLFPRVAVEPNMERSRMLAHNITHVRRFGGSAASTSQGDCLQAADARRRWSPTLVFGTRPGAAATTRTLVDVDSEQGVHFQGRERWTASSRPSRASVPSFIAQGAAHLRRGAVFGEYGRRRRRARRRRQGAARRARVPVPRAARAPGVRQRRRSAEEARSRPHIECTCCFCWVRPPSRGADVGSR